MKENSTEISKVLLNMLKYNSDIHNIVNDILLDKNLTQNILERAIVEQYVKNFFIQHNQKKQYFKKFILEIDQQIQTALVLGMAIDEIYSIITKSKDKILAILYELDIFINIEKEEYYKSYIYKYLNTNMHKLTYTQLQERKQIIEHKKKHIKKTTHLSSNSKEKLIKDAIVKLNLEQQKINYTSIANVSNRHPRTIKRYLKELDIKI